MTILYAKNIHLHILLYVPLRRPIDESKTATIHDTAAAILKHGGTMTAMKLHKLAFYAKAWHAVWHNEELFVETFQAWRNGPMSPDLYNCHRGTATVTNWPQGNSTNLNAVETATIMAILESYGKMSGQQLSDLVRQEDPWRNSRIGINPSVQSTNLIDFTDMREYYSALRLHGETI